MLTDPLIAPSLRLTLFTKNLHTLLILNSVYAIAIKDNLVTLADTNQL